MAYLSFNITLVISAARSGQEPCILEACTCFWKVVPELEHLPFGLGVLPFRAEPSLQPIGWSSSRLPCFHMAMNMNKGDKRKMELLWVCAKVELIGKGVLIEEGGSERLQGI